MSITFHDVHNNNGLMGVIFSTTINSTSTKGIVVKGHVNYWQVLVFTKDASLANFGKLGTHK